MGVKSVVIAHAPVFRVRVKVEYVSVAGMVPEALK